MCQLCTQSNSEDRLKIGFLHAADKISKMSKDQSTKVGAVFSDSEGEVINYGFNGMPRGIKDSLERNERPEKYKWFEHAERNTIYNVARPDASSKIMLSTHFPDMEGARAAVSVGVASFYTPSVNFASLSPQELKETKRVKELFSEANLQLNLIDINSDELSNKDFKISQHLKVLMEFAMLNSLAPIKKGSMILDPYTLAPVKNSLGFNTPPKSLKLTEEELLLQENQKYIIASEKASTYNIAKQTLRGSSCTATWFPCFDCALAISYVEASEVISRNIDINDPDDIRWIDSFKESQRLFSLANIKTTLLDVPKIDKNLSFDETSVVNNKPRNRLKK